MAQQTVLISLDSAIFDASAPPRFMQIAGNNFPIGGIGFSAGAPDEICYFRIPLENYGSGPLNLKFKWFAENSLTGNVVIGAQVATYSPSVDNTDLRVKDFDIPVEQQFSNLGLVTHRPFVANIVLNNIDGAQDGDTVWLKVYRKSSDIGNDTMAGRMVLSDDIVLTFSDV